MKYRHLDDLNPQIDAYLQRMSSRQYSPHTIRFYQLILKHWVAFANARAWVSTMCLNTKISRPFSVNPNLNTFPWRRSRAFSVPV